jgi:hypothetical protein
MGLKLSDGYMNIFARTDELPLQVELFNTAFKKAEFRMRITDKHFKQLMLPDSTKPLYFKSTIDENIARALAKIAFNYFTHKYGSHLALSEGFNEIRDYIRYGVKTSGHLITIDQKPLMTHQQRLQMEMHASHRITINQNINNNYIIGKMLLFDNVSVTVILSKCFGLVNIPMRGSQFDINSKKVIDIPSLTV